MNIKQKKMEQSKKLEIIVGIIFIILVFFGVLNIDENGNITIAGVEKQTTVITSTINNNKEQNEGNASSNTAENKKDTSSMSNIINEEDFEIYFLDVGQADSILISNNDANMLIDAGNNSDGKKICDYLKTLGVEKIDYLVGTHAHEDHIGGLDNVIKTFDIGTIYMPKKSATTKTFEDVIDAVSSKKLKVKSPKIGDTFSIGNAECEIMTLDDDAEDANLSSIVIEVTYGTQKFLFTGDMESINEESRSWNDIDVLKVAHHGSSSSSSMKFLNQVKPEISIISCGKNNDYGHPHKETLKSLNKINSEVYRTDLCGTIRLTSNGTENKLEFLDVSCDGNEEK